MFFGFAVDLPGHRKIRIRKDRAILRRQVADMPIAGDDLVIVPQIFVDGLCLRRRFNDDDFHESRLRAAFLQPIQRKETRLPGWRSTLPASSSSRRRVAIAAADKWHWRTSSSTATGVRPNFSRIKSSSA